MSDLLSVSHGLEAFGLALVIFGLLPGPLLRMLLSLYPKGHPCRTQVRADFDAIERYWERPFFVAQAVEFSLVEGLPQRIVAGGRRLKWRPLVEAIVVTMTTIGISFAIELAVAAVAGLFGATRGWWPTLVASIGSGAAGMTWFRVVGRALRRRTLLKGRP